MAFSKTPFWTDDKLDLENQKLVRLLYAMLDQQRLRVRGVMFVFSRKQAYYTICLVWFELITNHLGGLNNHQSGWSLFSTPQKMVFSRWNSLEIAKIINKHYFGNHQIVRLFQSTPGTNKLSTKIFEKFWNLRFVQQVCNFNL